MVQVVENVKSQPETKKSRGKKKTVLREIKNGRIQKTNQPAKRKKSRK